MVTRNGMAALVLIAVSLAGCNGARPISNSGYPDGDDHRRQIYPDMADRDTGYRHVGDQEGLDEVDLLIPAAGDDRGISTKQTVLLAI